MSETKTYMEQLDDWTNDTIIVPLGRACLEGGEWDYHQVTADIEMAVREKVLESYRNGQVAGSRREAREPQPERQRAWQKAG